MTLADIKAARPSKEMILFKQQLERKMEACRSLSEFEKLQKLINAIDKKLK
jgi:hypothetical protein